jgi:hypothetical protein
MREVEDGNKGQGGLVLEDAQSYRQEYAAESEASDCPYHRGHDGGQPEKSLHSGIVETPE